MSERQPYSRVYWSILDDAKFDAVRTRPSVLGAWTLLLIVADMAHPAPAFVPHGVTPKSLAALCDAGLVDALPGGRYRLHGLEAERARRTALARHETARHPDGTRTVPGRSEVGPLDETRRDEDETSLAAPSAGARDADPADAYWSLTGRYPTPKTLKWIDDLAGQYGQEPTTAALARAFTTDPSPMTLLGRTTDLLRAESRALDRKERDEERERVRQKRLVPVELPKWEQEFRAKIAERYARNEEASA